MILHVDPTVKHMCSFKCRLNPFPSNSASLRDRLGVESQWPRQNRMIPNVCQWEHRQGSPESMPHGEVGSQLIERTDERGGRLSRNERR